jgi:NDP-sugar pyrophosphorylase family protein
MLHFHEKGKYAATIGVKNYLHQIPYGCVKTNDNQIIEFEEKPILEKLVNTGIYILSPELISRVENHFFPITDLFTDCLECNNAIGAFKIEEDWIDVGQHAQLNFARNGHSNKNF